MITAVSPGGDELRAKRGRGHVRLIAPLPNDEVKPLHTRKSLVIITVRFPHDGKNLAPVQNGGYASTSRGPHARQGHPLPLPPIEHLDTRKTGASVQAAEHDRRAAQHRGRAAAPLRLQPHRFNGSGRREVS